MSDIPEKRTDADDGNMKREKVRLIPIKYIDDFPGHPFRVQDDEDMTKLIESINANGVLNPVIARKKEDDRYELISGHRRKHACLKLGVEVIPIIVRDISRDEAIIAMVDSNLQREKILPSEKAAAYKLKMEAMRRKAGRPCKENGTPLVSNFDGKKTTEIIGAENGESQEQVRRYIRLTELVPELLEMVDEGRIGFRPAVELSYLAEEEQRDLVETIDTEEATPSLAQAQRMKELSREGKLDMDKVFTIMTEEKGNQVEKIKISREKLNRYFPQYATPQQIEETIFRALELYRQRIRDVKNNDDRDDR